MRHTVLALTLITATTKAQWTLHDAHTTADLRGINNVGGGVAWASGTDGTILRTEDAGIVWQLCAKPPNGEHLDFRAIQAFDNDTAIIMSSGKGDLSRLYKTTDGCQSWHLLFTNPDKDGFWDALQFSREPGTRTDGLLLGDPVDGKFALFYTRNLGQTWTRDSEAPAAPKQSAFAASNSSLLLWGSILQGIATGGPKAMFIRAELHAVSDDVFSTQWVEIDSGLAAGTDSTGIFSVARAVPWNISGKHQGGRDPKAGTAIAVGGDYLKPNDSTGTAAFTTDGGLHWTAATTPPHGYRSAVAYDEKSKTWITVGPNGTDISTDDGRNWHALDPDPAFNDTPDADQHWNALSLPYAVGPHGRIGTLRPSALK